MPDMRVTLVSIIVEDQQTALAFYRDTLGFIVRDNIPLGTGDLAWLTLASPEQPDGARISLEPAGYPWAVDFQQALKANGVPLTAFAVSDVRAEYERLKAAGVTFKGEPRQVRGRPLMATFDDSCGNWIMIYEEPESNKYLRRAGRKFSLRLGPGQYGSIRPTGRSGIMRRFLFWHARPRCSRPRPRRRLPASIRKRGSPGFSKVALPASRSTASIFSRVRSSQIIDDTAIVYDAGRVLYVNRPRAGRNSLDRSDTLVTRLYSSRLCSIDVVHLLDSLSRMHTGTVFLGDFVPYRRPGDGD